MSAPRRLTGGNKIIAPLSLTFSATCRLAVNIMLRLLYLPGRNPVLIEQESGWAPDSVCTFWTRQKSLVPAGIQTSDRQAPILVAMCMYTLHIGNWKKAGLN